MSASGARHFVSVWNPSYALNGMEAHIARLLELGNAYDQKTVGEDELYVWWGKVRSQNRQQPQAHLDEILSFGRTLENGAEGETHLYLTDYRSLYVGEVLSITDRDVSASEPEHMPAYYKAESLNCDFWFKLGDIRRLVSDDLLAVIAELKKLRNIHYGDRPVSLYGGMVDLPLIVRREDDQRLFDPEERDRLTDDRLWAEFDVEEGRGLGVMERELRENLFGDSAWMSLESATRTFIATGEKVFRDHRTDHGFDFGPVIGSYAKALEVQCNAVLRRALRKLPATARRAKVRDRTVDLLEFGSLTLGELARTIGGEREVNRALEAKLKSGGWFTGSLPAILEQLREVRNPGTHAERIDRETAARWRNRLLGVGCTGDFVELARVTPR